MMSSMKNTARLAGFLYLLVAISGPFILIYVPGKLFVEYKPRLWSTRKSKLRIRDDHSGCQWVHKDFAKVVLPMSGPLIPDPAHDR